MIGVSMRVTPNSKYYRESRAVAMRNWEYKQNIASDGITRRLEMRDVMRLVLLNVTRTTSTCSSIRR